ncbi:Dehydrodolichyl diphosphate synthase 6 [Bienertia sinuspersici]
MTSHIKFQVKQLIRISYDFLLRCIFHILSVGPIPTHIAFIMDGNRRYARKNNIGLKDRYRPGFLALMSRVKHCYELGVKYITIFAFSLDNLRRQPEEIQRLMELLREKIEVFLENDGFIKKYGVRLYFVGNLTVLGEDIHAAANRLMEETANNTTTYLLVCVGYTSTYEMVHAFEESIHLGKENRIIELEDIEKQMYMSIAPKPDILIRSSGETRLSNFLLWQTEFSLLYCPSALWPELGLWHMVWALLNYQRHYAYFQKKMKN